VDRVEDDALWVASYEEFHRGREPTTSVVEAWSTVGVPNCPTDLVKFLFAQVVGHSRHVEGPACRVYLKLSIHSVEEGEDSGPRCQATEVYDDGMVIMSISEEGEVETCSLPCPDSRPVEA
jgi:hypothetical protein